MSDLTLPAQAVEGIQLEKRNGTHFVVDDEALVSADPWWHQVAQST